MSLNNPSDLKLSTGNHSGNIHSSHLELAYMLPLKKIQSVRSSINYDKRVRSYGKIQTDFLRAEENKYQLLRTEMVEP